MKRLFYTINTISPVVLSSTGNANNVVYTKDFIPGAVVRGMLAGRYIQKNRLGADAHKNPVFYAWFLGNEILFRNAYIAPNFHFDQSYPAPLSIQHEKYDKKQIYDLLRENPEYVTKSFAGYLSPNDSSLTIAETKRKLNYHHERNSDKGVVKSGIFFNYESVDANQIFQGEIAGPEKELIRLKDFFENEKSFYIGRSKNNQYGRIHFDIKNELHPFPEKVHFANSTIALLMMSPAIICNDCGFSTTDVDVLEKTLQKILGNGITISKSFFKKGEIENYVSVWKLRKPDEVCFKEGSCFLLEGIKENQGSILKDLQEKGIGERTQEGYGQIKFFKILPTQIEELSHEIDDRQEPDEFPEQTQLILKEMVEDIIKEQVYNLATKEADSFDKIPKNSLLGRLEYMVKERKFNVQEFEQLNETAKKQLEKSISQNTNLFSFINEKLKKSFLLKDVLKESNPKVNFVKEMRKNPRLETYFNSLESTDELRDLYFKNFLVFMRKKGETGENRNSYS
jgi:CRISPR-associated protein Csx10